MVSLRDEMRAKFKGLWSFPASFDYHNFHVVLKQV